MKKTTTDPKFIFSFFFHFFYSLFLFLVMPFFMSQHFFPSVPFNSFGWVVKFCMCNFFCCFRFVKVFTPTNDFCFTSCNFFQRFSVVMLSFENPFEHSFKSYCNEFKRFQTEAHTKNCSTPIKWKRKKKYTNIRRSNAIPFEIAALEFH